jgi:hypothetical protein
MGEDTEIRLVRIFQEYFFHIGVHFRADTLAGRKKIFCDIYFPGYLLFGDLPALLVGEGKRLYIAQNGKAGIGKARDKSLQRKIKADEEKDKETDVESRFFTHGSSIFAHRQVGPGQIPPGNPLRPPGEPLRKDKVKEVQGFICNIVAFILFLPTMRRKINWDALGITASLLCAVHCAVLPLAIASLPVLGVNIINNAPFEYGMIALAFGIGSWALWHGYHKHHRRLMPWLFFSGGMLFLLAKQVWHAYQFGLLPFAVILIVTAHVLNYRLCRGAPGTETAISDLRERA